MQKTIDEAIRFADEMGLLCEDAGLPRITGRLLGWLLVCEPAHQSLADLTAALGISKASASTATRFLVHIGLVERTILPGDRRDYFRVAGDAWAKFFRRRMGLVSALRQIAERGLEILNGAPAARRGRLEQMHRLYAFLDEAMPALIDQFEAQELRKHRPERPSH
jgi:DNA-binding transcriptional regulator GbsR (MarR family)